MTAPPTLKSIEPEIVVDNAEEAISCPPTYRTRSILVLLFAFLPLGVAALIQSHRVEQKYRDRDYEGALLASRRAKSLCIWGVGFGLASIAILACLLVAVVSLVISIPPKTIVYPATEESAARKYLAAAIARQQEASKTRANHKLIPTLKEMNLTVPANVHYQFEGKLTIDPATNRQKFILTARPTVEGVLKGFSGMVYEIERSNRHAILTTGICAAAQPSTNFAVPTIEAIDNKIQCGN
jgi:hypothetical protein